MEDLEVVAIRPLSGSSIPVVGVVLGWQVYPGNVIKVGQADHGGKFWQGMVGGVPNDALERSVWLIEEWAGGQRRRYQGRGNGGLNAHFDDFVK